MPGNAGGPPPAQMASAKASSTAGFIAVSLAAAISSAGAPASPLLKCSDISQWRVLSNSASTRRGRCFSCNKETGSQVGPIGVKNLTDLVAVAGPVEVAWGALSRSSATAKPGANFFQNMALQKVLAGRVTILSGGTTVKSRGDAASDSRNGFQTSSAWRWFKP